MPLGGLIHTNLRWFYKHPKHPPPMQATETIQRLYGEGHRALEDFLGESFAPAEVNIVRGMGPLACYAHGSPFIHIDSGLAGLVEGNGREHSFSLRRDLNRNLGVEMDGAGFVQSVGIHEDLHRFFFERYIRPLAAIFNRNGEMDSRGSIPVFYEVKPGVRYSHVIENVTHKEIAPNPIIQAINEAFAFWGMERLTGQRHIFDEFADQYSNKLGRAAGNALKFFYLLFHEQSRRKGDRYIVDNLVPLVAQYLPRMQSVSLTRLDELLSSSENGRSISASRMTGTRKPGSFDDVYQKARICFN